MLLNLLPFDLKLIVWKYEHTFLFKKSLKFMKEETSTIKHVLDTKQDYLKHYDITFITRCSQCNIGWVIYKKIRKGMNSPTFEDECLLCKEDIRQSGPYNPPMRF